MLTKNCRLILDTILALDEREHFKSHPLRDLYQMTKLPSDQVLAACKELDKDNYAKLKIIHPPRGGDIADSIKLTELGKNYKQRIRSARRELWLKNAWIPIIVSFATTLITNYILPKLPQILRWAANSLSRISSP